MYIKYSLFCRFDFLKVANEDNDNFGKHCGVKTGQTVLVFGDHAILTFHSDNHVEDRGFLLFFTAIPHGIK